MKRTIPPILAAILLQIAVAKEASVVHVCDESCAHFQAGLEAARREDWPKVIAEFSIVIDHRSDSASLCAAYINRGRARMMSADLDGSLIDFEAALKAVPSSASAFSWRASVYSAKGDKRRAVADCSRAIELDPNETSAYVTRATSYGSLKEYAKALADYDLALRHDPKNFPALLGRALVRDHLHDKEGAIADLEAALLLDPTFEKAARMLERLKKEQTEEKPNQSSQHNAGSGHAGCCAPVTPATRVAG